MRVLIIGGTGLISTGIIKHLLARKARVTMFNRGQRENRLADGVEAIHGDRNQTDTFERLCVESRYDVVIDMICFTAKQAESDIRAFGGRCEHFIFCSTVCSYGFKAPYTALVDENFPQEPTNDYGRGKLECERAFLRADEAGKFHATVIRPSHTYGPSCPLIDNLEFDSVAWDRIARGLPVLCAGDGLGLWVSTHRDDCGKLFAYGALNRKTYGQCYNATRDQNITWRQYHREVATVLGEPARLLFMPAGWIYKQEPARFGLLREITQWHGAYDSSKAKRDVPEFGCEIDLPAGAAETFADQRRRKVWRTSQGDGLYQSMVDKTLAAGVEPVEA